MAPGIKIVIGLGIAVVIVAAAGFVKFNIIGDDIYVETETGEVVKYNDLEVEDVDTRATDYNSSRSNKHTDNAVDIDADEEATSTEVTAEVVDVEVATTSSSSVGVKATDYNSSRSNKHTDN